MFFWMGADDCIAVSGEETTTRTEDFPDLVCLSTMPDCRVDGRKMNFSHYSRKVQEVTKYGHLSDVVAYFYSPTELRISLMIMVKIFVLSTRVIAN